MSIKISKYTTFFLVEMQILIDFYDKNVEMYRGKP